MKVKKVNHWFEGMSIEEQAGLYYYYWVSLAEEYKKLEEKYNRLYELRCEEKEINDNATMIQIDVKRLMEERDKDIYRQKLKDIEEIVKLCDTPCAKEILDIIGDE